MLCSGLSRERPKPLLPHEGAGSASLSIKMSSREWSVTEGCSFFMLVCLHECIPSVGGGTKSYKSRLLLLISIQNSTFKLSRFIDTGSGDDAGIQSSCLAFTNFSFWRYRAVPCRTISFLLLTLQKKFLFLWQKQPQWRWGLIVYPETR